MKTKIILLQILAITISFCVRSQSLFVGGSLYITDTSANPALYVQGNTNIASTGSIINRGRFEFTGNITSTGSFVSTGTEIFSGTGNQSVLGDFSDTNYFGNIIKKNTGNIIITDTIDCTTFDFQADGTIDLSSNALMFVKSPTYDAIKNFSANRFMDVGDANGFLKRVMNDTSGNAYAFPLGNDTVGYQPFSIYLKSLGTTGISSVTGTLSDHVLGTISFDTIYQGYSGGYPDPCSTPFQMKVVGLNCLAQPMWTFWGPNDYTYHITAVTIPCDNGLISRIVQSPIGSGEWNTHVSDVSGSFAQNMCEHSDWSGALPDIPGGSYRGFGKDFAAASGAAAPLPVELVTLRADAIDNRFIRISWETATETNNRFFSVTRSSDASHFDSIGIVSGSGTTMIPHKYSFDDHNVVPDTIYYYRLNQVDYNGVSRISSIVSASISDTSKMTLSITPNPTAAMAQIHSDNQQFSAYDPFGRLVATGFGTIDLSQEPSGMYFIHVQNHRVIKLVKTK